MNPPNPLTLLNRVRPKSCPAQERWSLSIGDVVADVVHAPEPLRRAVRLLNHFGGVAFSAESVEFDGDDVEWSDVTAPAKVHYRGVLHDKELSPGVLAALVLTDPAVRECLQEAAHTASTYGRPTTTPSTRQAGARTESSRRSPSSRRDFGVIGSAQRN